MELFKSASTLVMSEKCYETFFVDFNFFHADCLKMVISKVLGYSIILGAILVKVPQIQKIVKASSAVGISFTSLLLELHAITSMLSYSIARSFPFSTWGDSFFLMVQVVILGALINYYKGKSGLAVIFVLIYAIILYVLISGLTPISVLSALQASNMPAIVIAKLIQAAENIKNGHTGHLSAITVYLTFIGSAARIFTSIQETGDMLVIATYIVSTTANGVIAFQIYWYWTATEKFIEKQKKD